MSNAPCLCGEQIDKAQAEKESVDGFKGMCEGCHEYHEEMAKGPPTDVWERLGK